MPRNIDRETRRKVRKAREPKHKKAMRAHKKERKHPHAGQPHSRPVKFLFHEMITTHGIQMGDYLG